MARTVARGGAAGAAGTVALDAVSYADMALRGRGASGAPGAVVDRLARDTGHPVPGTDEVRANRLSALGALSGMAVGCGVGVTVSLLRRAGVRMPWWLGTLTTGALAMAAADVPLAKLGVSDPSTWSAADWASDIAPHLMYGLVTYAVVVAGED
ncbi:hypothetical protein KUM39_19410 [Streptomyces sp. J2-1]|nr:hypothetical protein [Streptomyces corallincola]MBV2356519.1 hypothetical protein [Streptomyces corallincola]